VVAGAGPASAAPSATVEPATSLTLPLLPLPVLEEPSAATAARGEGPGDAALGVLHAHTPAHVRRAGAAVAAPGPAPLSFGDASPVGLAFHLPPSERGTLSPHLRTPVVLVGSDAASTVPATLAASQAGGSLQSCPVHGSSASAAAPGRAFSASTRTLLTTQGSGPATTQTHAAGAVGGVPASPVPWWEARAEDDVGGRPVDDHAAPPGAVSVHTARLSGFAGRTSGAAGQRHAAAAGSLPVCTCIAPPTSSEGQGTEAGASAASGGQLASPPRVYGAAAGRYASVLSGRQLDLVRPVAGGAGGAPLYTHAEEQAEPPPLAPEQAEPQPGRQEPFRVAYPARYRMERPHPQEQYVLSPTWRRAPSTWRRPRRPTAPLAAAAAWQTAEWVPRRALAARGYMASRRRRCHRWWSAAAGAAGACCPRLAVLTAPLRQVRAPRPTLPRPRQREVPLQPAGRVTLEEEAAAAAGMALWHACWRWRLA
jgi:hypothetical protein